MQEHWQGTWTTTGIHGKIKLKQDDADVTGFYPRGGEHIGSIRGTADLKELEGHYSCDGRGTFKIHLIAGGDAFEGWYKPRGDDKVDWSGERN